VRVTTRVGLFFAVFALSPAALADAGPKVHDSWFLPFGVSAAYAIHDGTSNGFAGGLELSIVHNDEFDWKGAYVDLVRDFANEHTRLSIGPEIGAAFVGIDGGYLLDTGGDRARHGFCLRPMFSLGFVMAYGRIEQLIGSEHETLGEIGILIKFPVLLHEGENQMRPERPRRLEPPPGPIGPVYQPMPGPFAQPPPP
jgi:hypothetical protein